jgi:DNA-binding IclR family transcriptional regulator
MRLVPGLDRGLRILAYLAAQDRPVATSAIGRDLQIPRSATYELINTLLAHRAVVQGDDGRVALGPQVFVLGNAYGNSLDLVASAQRVAQEVMTACEETCQVAILDGRSALYIVKADPPRTVRLVSSIGARLPAHCTAIGKVLLAGLDPDELVRRLESAPLEKLTERSITDIPTLLESISKTRSSGWASEEGESNDEVACVAVPILDATGSAIAAMSVSVPSSRMNDQRRFEILETLRAGKQRLSSTLGYSGTTD